MQRFNNNRLVSQFAQTPYMGNPLLASPQYVNNPQMQRHMMMLKDNQRMREMENRKPQQYDANQMRNIILGVQKVDTKISSNEFNEKFNNYECKYTNENEKKRMWCGRTNQPYKNVLYDVDYKKEYKLKEDLIVYKVSKTDKNKNIFEQEIKQMEGKISEHDSEIKQMYPLSKEDEYKEKFEYNNIAKFTVKYDPANHEELVDYYKKEQQESEKNKQTIDDVIAFVVTNNVQQNDGDTTTKEENVINQSENINKQLDSDTPKNDGKDKYRNRQKKTVV